jgi:hypothetical protein
MADDARRDNRAGGPLQCGGVRRSAQELALAGVMSGLCAGCLPEGAPPWLVDHAIAAALRIEVAERGPFSPESPRADREVASVLPGDTIRATPFIVGPDGPADLSAVRPAWFYCGVTSCLGAVARGEATRPCGVEPVPPVDTCSMGQAASGGLQLGSLTSFSALNQRPPGLFMVAGTPGGPSTAECLKRLQSDLGETLAACLLVITPLPLGPAWRLIALGAFLGVPDAPPLSAIPVEAQEAEPELFPAVLPFELQIFGDDGASRAVTAEPGATVTVRAGEIVEVVAPTDPLDTQYFVDAVVTSDGQPSFASGYELLSSSWLFTADVAPAQTEPGVTRWTVPEAPGEPLFGYFLLSDQRSLVWAWLRFEVEAP